MAGLAPKPARKYPIPTMLGEFEMQIIKTPTVQISQDILIAIFLPQLSAK